MKELNEHQIALLNHLYNGGEIENTATIEDFRDRTGLNKLLMNNEDEIELDKLSEYSIYLTEKDKIIIGLQDKIDILQLKVKDADEKRLNYKRKYVQDINKEAEADSTARRRATAGSKVQYKHLQADEIKEIEGLFRANPNTNKKDISNSYGASLQIIRRIEDGEHGKSSPEFQLFRRNNPKVDGRKK